MGSLELSWFDKMMPSKGKKTPPFTRSRSKAAAKHAKGAEMHPEKGDDAPSDKKGAPSGEKSTSIDAAIVQIGSHALHSSSSETSYQTGKTHGDVFDSKALWVPSTPAVTWHESMAKKNLPDVWKRMVSLKRTKTDSSFAKEKVFKELLFQSVLILPEVWTDLPQHFVLPFQTIICSVGNLSDIEIKKHEKKLLFPAVKAYLTILLQKQFSGMADQRKYIKEAKAEWKRIQSSNELRQSENPSENAIQKVGSISSVPDTKSVTVSGT